MTNTIQKLTLEFDLSNPKDADLFQTVAGMIATWHGTAIYQAVIPPPINTPGPDTAVGVASPKPKRASKSAKAGEAVVTTTPEVAFAASEAAEAVAAIAAQPDPVAEDDDEYGFEAEAEAEAEAEVIPPAPFDREAILVELRAMVREHIAAFGIPDTSEVFASFNAAKLGDLPDEKLPIFRTILRDRIANGGG